MLTSEQVRAARALLRWEQKDVAEASGVSLPSIKRLEAKAGALAAQDRTVEAIRIALVSAGVEFIPENGGGAGVRLATRADGGTGSRSVEQQRASANDVRAEAAGTVDRVLSEVDATKQEKAERRGALTDEPAVIAKARGKGQVRKS